MRTLLLLTPLALASCATSTVESTPAAESAPTAAGSTLPLGAFSISLSVEDLATSRAFYEALGFVEHGGGMEQNYLVMKNGDALVGLFQEMFEGNIITFNPGWDVEKRELDSFMDVREIQARLEAAGIELVERADPDTEGPAYLTLFDPDGNVILIDQHR